MLYSKGIYVYYISCIYVYYIGHVYDWWLMIDDIIYTHGKGGIYTAYLQHITIINKNIYKNINK